MPSLYDNAGLRQATSGILHYLHTKMCGIPEDCLVEVWAMAHPQIEGLERASELIIPAASGYANSALQGEVLDVETFTHEDGYRFSRIFASDSASPKLLFTQDNLHCVHTTQAYTYIFTVEEDHFYRIPRSTSLSRDLHDEERFSLRPWSAGDGQSSGVFWATSCDASFVYGMPLDGIIEIDVEDDIGRYRTIQSGDLGDVSATILNGKATLFWLHGESPRNAYKWTRGCGGSGSQDRCTPFLDHFDVEFVLLTVSNDVGWLRTRWSLKGSQVWQVDLIAENVLAVFAEPAEPYDLFPDLHARPDGTLWATLDTLTDKFLVEVWKPVFGFRTHAPIMLCRAPPII